MPDTNNNKPASNSSRNKMVAIAVGSVMFVGSIFGVQAIASSNTFQHLKLASSDMSAYSGAFQDASWSKGWGHHRKGHGGRDRFSNMSDSEIEKLVARMVAHAAIEIDATAEQQEKIATLVTALAKEMKPLRGNMQEAGKQAHDLLLSDAIDRIALEKLRAERLAEIDAMSKNITNALADVAEILTPQQRKKVDERIKEFRDMRGGHGWRRG